MEGVLDSLAASQIASETAIVVFQIIREPRLLAEALRAGVRAVLPSVYHQTNSSPPSKPLRRTDCHASRGSDAMFPAARGIASTCRTREPLRSRKRSASNAREWPGHKQIAQNSRSSEHTVNISAWRRIPAASSGCGEPHRSCLSRHSAALVLL